MDGLDHVMQRSDEKCGCNLGSIQVSGVLHCARVIAIVSILDHRVKELTKHLMGKIKHSVFPGLELKTQQLTANINSNLVALLISSYHAHSLDKGVSRIVHPSLDALVQGPVVGGCLVPQVSINGWGQCCCHAVVVLPQIREISAVESYQQLT